MELSDCVIACLNKIINFDARVHYLPDFVLIGGDISIHREVIRYSKKNRL